MSKHQQNKETQTNKKPSPPQAAESKNQGPAEKILARSIAQAGDIPSQVAMLKRLSPAQQQTLVQAISSRQGNGHVQRLMKAYAANTTPPSPRPPAPTLQAKLTVNPPDDIYEQEADKVADHVMRMPASPTPPPPEDPGGDPPPAVAAGRPQPTFLPLASEARIEGGPPPLQAKFDGVGPVDSNVETHIEQMRGGGQPLPTEERNFFEERMGADFSNARIHTDPNAIQAARDLNARAFTVGSNIAFNAGEYAPGTTAGRTLLARELTHVAQQGGAVQCKRKEPDAPSEQPQEEPLSTTSDQAAQTKLADPGQAFPLEGPVSEAKTPSEIDDDGEIEGEVDEYYNDSDSDDEMPEAPSFLATPVRTPEPKTPATVLLVEKDTTDLGNLPEPALNAPPTGLVGDEKAEAGESHRAANGFKKTSPGIEEDIAFLKAAGGKTLPIQRLVLTVDNSIKSLRSAGEDASIDIQTVADTTKKDIGTVEERQGAAWREKLKNDRKEAENSKGELLANVETSYKETLSAIYFSTVDAEHEIGKEYVNKLSFIDQWEKRAPARMKFYFSDKKAMWKNTALELGEEAAKAGNDKAEKYLDPKSELGRTLKDNRERKKYAKAARMVAKQYAQSFAKETKEKINEMKEYKRKFWELSKIARQLLEVVNDGSVKQLRVKRDDAITQTNKIKDVSKVCINIQYGITLKAINDQEMALTQQKAVSKRQRAAVDRTATTAEAQIQEYVDKKEKELITVTTMALLLADREMNSVQSPDINTLQGDTLEPINRWIVEAQNMVGKARAAAKQGLGRVGTSQALVEIGKSVTAAGEEKKFKFYDANLNGAASFKNLKSQYDLDAKRLAEIGKELLEENRGKVEVKFNRFAEYASQFNLVEDFKKERIKKIEDEKQWAVDIKLAAANIQPWWKSSVVKFAIPIVAGVVLGLLLAPLVAGAATALLGASAAAAAAVLITMGVNAVVAASTTVIDDVINGRKINWRNVAISGLLGSLGTWVGARLLTPLTGKLAAALAGKVAPLIGKAITLVVSAVANIVNNVTAELALTGNVTPASIVTAILTELGLGQFSKTVFIKGILSFLTGKGRPLGGKLRDQPGESGPPGSTNDGIPSTQDFSGDPQHSPVPSSERHFPPSEPTTSAPPDVTSPTTVETGARPDKSSDDLYYQAVSPDTKGLRITSEKLNELKESRGNDLHTDGVVKKIKYHIKSNQRGKMRLVYGNKEDLAGVMNITEQRKEYLKVDIILFTEGGGAKDVFRILIKEIDKIGPSQSTISVRLGSVEQRCCQEYGLKNFHPEEKMGTVDYSYTPQSRKSSTPGDKEDRSKKKTIDVTQQPIYGKLNSTQKGTLEDIFARPVRPDILWEDIVKLLNACGADIAGGKGSAVSITLRGQTANFHRPHGRQSSITLRGTVRQVCEFLIKTGVIK